MVPVGREDSSSIVSDAIWAFVDLLPTFAELGRDGSFGCGRNECRAGVAWQKTASPGQALSVGEFHGRIQQAARWTD
jgi:hypothetical protein